MKPKITMICNGIFFLFFFLLSFMVIFFADDTDSGGNNKDSSIPQSGVITSQEVLAHRPLVEKYGKEYGIEDYVSYILAIIQVELGGAIEDVMQSSESLGLPPNNLRTEESIKQGVKYLSELLASMEQQGADADSVIRSCNYGGGFLNYAANHGRTHTYGLAEQFSKEKSSGQKANYPNLITIPVNGGRRYNYGDQFHVQLVSQYLTATSPTEFDDETVQVIMDEALRYEGFPYVFGGVSPTTSFDCGGLIQWAHNKTGISPPRVARNQYDATQEVSMEEVQADNLIFFHSTYNVGTYVTHIGIYVGDNRMFHANNPVGYTDLNTSYWQDHLIGAKRVIHG